MTATFKITEFDRLTDENLIHLLGEKQGAWRGVQLAALQKTTLTAAADCEPFARDDCGEWRATRWIGAFGLGERRWEITPRIGQDRFNLLARCVLTAAIVRGGKRAIAASAGALDLLPLAWHIAFQNAVGRSGLPKAYVRRSAKDCTELRGTLDLERQLTDNLLDQQHLACQWDEITHNNPINQASRLTTAHLRKHSRFPFVGSQNLAKQEITRWDEAMALMGVDIPLGMPADNTVRWSGANDSFRVAHQLAGWVIQNRGEASGRTNAPAILIDSAEVWELYLFERLRVVVDTNETLDFEVSWPRSTEKNYLLKWAGSHVRGLIPDFTLTRKSDQGKQVVAVLDAKYRWYKSPANDTAIAEQMAFYAITANQQYGQSTVKSSRLPALALIYPKAPSMNTHIKSGLIDDGHFLMLGQPSMSAWTIELPDPSDAGKFHSFVDEQLLQMLLHLFDTVK